MGDDQRGPVARQVFHGGGDPLEQILKRFSARRRFMLKIEGPLFDPGLIRLPDFIPGTIFPNAEMDLAPARVQRPSVEIAG